MVELGQGETVPAGYTCSGFVFCSFLRNDAVVASGQSESRVFDEMRFLFASYVDCPNNTERHHRKFQTAWIVLFEEEEEFLDFTE